MSFGVISFGISLYGPSVALFGMAEAARRIGYATSIVSLGKMDRDSIRAALDHLTEVGVDGIVVIAPVRGVVHAVQGGPSTVPLVIFEPGAISDTTSVAVDEVLGARLATRHLLDLGHETVRHVSGPEGWLGTDARVRGWQAELMASGRIIREPIAGDWTARSGYQVGEIIVRQKDTTAVFVANDQMALGVLQAFHSAGVRVPEDISVVGFDDVPEAAFYQPSLTTVRLDFAEVGRRCVDLLLGMIQGTTATSVGAVPPELIVRASTAQLRVNRAEGSGAGTEELKPQSVKGQLPSLSISHNKETL